MKKFLLILITTFITFCAFSQITVTNAVFPQVGDVYYTSGEGPGTSVTITPAGPNQTWVYDQFAPFTLDTSEILPASQGTVGADYPTADILLPLGGTNEGYAKNSGNQLELIGVFGGLGFGAQGFNLPLSPTSVLLNTPMTYNSTFQDQNGSFVAFDPQDFPFLQALLDSLLPPLITVDSIRNIQTTDRTDEVDAWGTLTTNHGTFDVLRVKKTSITDRNIEFLTFLGWIDPSTLGAQIPFAGKDTTLTYDFISATEKVAIMSVNVDDITGTILSVRYKVDPSELVTSIEDEVENGSYFNAYPNPATNAIDIEISLKQAGNYNIDVYNILGVKQVSKQQYVNGHTIASIDISHLTKGNYLYSISNDQGEILFTKRLSVIRP